MLIEFAIVAWLMVGAWLFRLAPESSSAPGPVKVALGIALIGWMSFTIICAIEALPLLLGDEE